MKHSINLSLIKCIILCLFGINNAFAQKHWDSLSGRFQWSNAVRAMYADTNYIYAAGAFNEVGGIPMKGIARWNGIKWDSLGAGIDGATHSGPANTLAITSYHNKLYVGGVFGSLGNVVAASIGRWDGTNWDSLPVRAFTYNYISSQAIETLTVINNKLYVGGDFDSIAGFPCIGIAQWNDTNWSSLNFPNLPGGVDISSICEYKGSIYAGGNYSAVNCNDSARNILRCDSIGWHSVGGGMKGCSSWIMSMAVYNNELYAAGYFFKSDGNAGDNIQRWDGTKWSDVGGGINWEVFNLIVFNGKLYAMGTFTTAGAIPADEIAEWDGTKWCGLGSKFDNGIEQSCVYKDSLYIGGGFATIDGDSISYIAKWIGGNYVDSCGVDAAGINEIGDKSEDVRVYPNPSGGKFTIQSSVVSNQLSVEVYNVFGQRVFEQLTMDNGQWTINISGQPDGVYFYRVVGEDGEVVGSGKIVIVK